MARGNGSNQITIYHEELAVMDRAIEEWQGRKGQNDSLLVEYKNLISEYGKLLSMVKKITMISDAQSTMLRRRESDIKTILDNANQGFLTLGQELLVNSMYSAECTRIFGLNIEKKPIEELFWADEQDLKDKMRMELQSVFTTTNDQEALGILNRLPSMTIINGKYITIEYKWIPGNRELSDEDLIMVILTDVTEEMRSQERTNYLNFHDSLTTLYNRNFIEPLLELPPTAGQLPYSLILIDMNGLKLTNDVFGHRIGDKLLMKAADILRSTCTIEGNIVSRWGGDEFLVLLPNVNEVECNNLVQAIKSVCRQTEPDPIQTSMSMGCLTLNNTDSTLYDAFIIAEKYMYKEKLLESKLVRESMLEGIIRTMRTRKIIDLEQQERLLQASMQFAEYIGIHTNSSLMSQLRLIVQLHDVGNLAVPESILNKPTTLDPQEWEIVKSHSEVGYRLAHSIGEWEIADAILGIHENWDGSGYPYGLANDEIPILSRVFMIVDAFDIMTHDQVYKKAKSIPEALEEIAEQSGKQFDPELANLFLEWYKDK